MTAPTAASILLAAADHCDETGLHKGELWPGAWQYGYYVTGDPCCAEGHIRVASGNAVGTLLDGPEARALDLLADEVGTIVESWNDTPARTAPEVSAALRAAAERAT
jgi:hypothetical protein